MKKKVIDIDKLITIEEDEQLEIVKDNIDSLKDMKVDIEFFLDLRTKTMEYLLKDSYFQNLVINTRVDYIDIIIEKGLTLPINIQDNKDVINKYASIEDINKYFEYTNNLGNNGYLLDAVRKKRNIYYDELMESIDSKLNIFQNYIYIYKGLSSFDEPMLEFQFEKVSSNQEKSLKFLQELTITKMLEITVDRFYHDLTYNFLKNIGSMLNYIDKEKINLLPLNRLAYYRNFLNYYNLSMKERLDLYDDLKNNGRNNMADFYDDFKTIKNYANKKIKDSLFRIDENKLKTKKTGEKYYELNGEDFKMLVTSTYFPRFSSKYPDRIWDDKHVLKASSLSLIGNNNIRTFRNPFENVVLGFTDYNIDNIMLTYENDAYTDKTGSNRVQKFYTPSELINKTDYYNEIQISEEYEYLHPSYIVCYDTIKEGDRLASKMLGNIPFVIINTYGYNHKDKFHIDRDVYKFPAEASGTVSYRNKL